MLIFFQFNYNFCYQAIASPPTPYKQRSHFFQLPKNDRIPFNSPNSDRTSTPKYRTPSTSQIAIPSVSFAIASPQLPK
ncbi:hypothetical protein [Anabaena azotica]|uniref:hypothetical protein n=1 Tax=Anabaena azotica TaxID=197653 RepID=UPI0039A55F38